jgi:DNA ligase-1
MVGWVGNRRRCMYSLNSVVEIVKELESVTSTKAKEHILRKNADNTVLQKVLFYTYGDMQYGIQKKTVEKMTFENDEDYRWDNVWSMFEDLSKSNINNDLVLKISNTVGYYTDKNIQDLLLKILLKDLRCNINVKSINKAIPNLIPQHQIMLASKFEGKLKSKVSMSLKMDGIRNSILIENGNIKHISRQGKVVLGLEELNESLRKQNLDGYMLDGELIRKNIDNIPSDDNFRLTTKIVNSKSTDKRGLEFVVFDIVPIEDYYKGESKLLYEERLKLLENLIEENEFIRLVPKFGITDDVEYIYKVLDDVVNNGEEGLMLNTLNGKYGFGKRSKDILKVKKMQTCDIRCLRIEEGEGKYQGKLGKIICNYKGYELGVGSGFNDEQREYYYNNPNEIIGHIVEVQYFEESKNEKGELSCRFPIFKYVRDKNEESYD